MKRDYYKDNEKETKRLDVINNERYENSLNRVAESVRILETCKNTQNKLSKGNIMNIAKVVNILENVSVELRWHCEWFGYNEDVCMAIDDVCADLGPSMAEFYLPIENERDEVVVECGIIDALSRLSKVLAVLVMWNNDDSIEEVDDEEET